jgi:hypothetical protein
LLVPLGAGERRGAGLAAAAQVVKELSLQGNLNKTEGRDRER